MTREAIRGRSVSGRTTLKTRIHYAIAAVVLAALLQVALCACGMPLTRTTSPDGIIEEQMDVTILEEIPH